MWKSMEPQTPEFDDLFLYPVSPPEQVVDQDKELQEEQDKDTQFDVRLKWLDLSLLEKCSIMTTIQKVADVDNLDSASRFDFNPIKGLSPKIMLRDVISLCLMQMISLDCKNDLSDAGVLLYPVSPPKQEFDQFEELQGH
ncbi:hypothetical protein FQA39_LY01709 [Lamprigera yunnana]|nr:hypothetical protein FQA39_LY01709 [Lamprigera yunnana]